MTKGCIEKILDSWSLSAGNVHTTEEILQWIQGLNQETHVSVRECSILESDFWFYDDYNGEILNRKRSFFSIKGVRLFVNDAFVKEQPMILQPEIGYLGIIVREIDGVWNFLMQAKIEPGNVNCVQISPTIQATKSNFTRAHGGKLPAYFEMFEHSERYEVIYDQIQSEQASRFLNKRNRNIIIKVDEDFEILPNFRWMTLGQLKTFMKIDNLVNMDTRTVLSGLPFVTETLSDSDLNECRTRFKGNPALFRSIFETNLSDTLRPSLHYLNNYKMFTEVRPVKAPLNELIDWRVNDHGVHCLKKASFEVAFYDIEISGREVHAWTQPLFKASGKAIFALLVKEIDGVLKFLVKARPEIGSYDKIELGPSIQLEAAASLNAEDSVEGLFLEWMAESTARNHTLVDVLLSEEGGRFYHEQNRNIILQIPSDRLSDLPDGYFWMDFSALNLLVQSQNYLNIQLRNLLSLLPLDA